MRYILRAILVCTLLASPARGEELYGLGGVIGGFDASGSSYSWQIEYRQTLNEYLAFSISYLNEGHLPDHRRDGQSAQLWARTSLADRRLSLSAGIGPYFYYDTKPTFLGTYVNDHGWALNSSLALTWQTESRWQFQLRSNLVSFGANLESVSALAGIGYLLDEPAVAAAEPSRSGCSAKLRPNELTLFLGRTIVNSFDSEQSVAYSIEYRRRIMEYLEGSVGWLYEGDSRLVRRNGFTTQLWVARDFLDDRLSIGAGGGLYFNADRYHHVVSNADTDRLVSGVVSLTGSWRLAPELELRSVWHRIVTNYDRDTDVLLGGIGYRF